MVGPIISSRAAVLRVTLELEHREVSREIIVPANMTFDTVHMVIQRAFGWKNMYLHEFYILGKEGQSIVNLVGDNENLAYEDDLLVKLEDGFKLSEYLPATMKYVYDFGDDWLHRIETEKVITDYDKNYPVCLEAHGNAPPEDVGGETGYEEFLDVIADEQHPDHRDLKAWVPYARVSGRKYKRN
ncbi:plasmid pRiA4b ORF-3 family protein [Salicibibacter cibi]|uniref:plasmid pRiA4b ORF-3 family protein n=1 Tax=Salicibibacter cibi TaxID=2743001 RepID=UPI0019067C10|nr:plasmid pRiA4b ORF-3 family protein [Salicibibacter cibi]